jgi:hypothetical protein
MSFGTFRAPAAPAKLAAWPSSVVAKIGIVKSAVFRNVRNVMSGLEVN